ncbi:hypothetical protein ABZP36_035454 [Zizania latifolia]
MMEVRASSEQGMMAGREPFGLPKSSPPSSGGMQSVRMAYTPDGTPVFTPVSSAPPAAATYQPGGGVAPGPSAGAAGGNGAPALQADAGGPVLKKKRGRPIKYDPYSSMSLALVPASTAAAAAVASGTLSPAATKSADTVPSATPVGGKKRGRPKGSTNKKHVPSFGNIGSAGAGFTPHVIVVKAGEDVSAKIMSFSQHGNRGVCVLSANGAISNVTLWQTATSGGTVKYEGQFEILSLSGSFLPSENGGHHSRTGALSVSLAGPDGRVLGGGVAELLTAASPVQIVVGSFNTDGKKEPKLHAPSDPVSALPKIALVGGTGPSSSPPASRGTLSESSGGPGSPLNQGVTASNHGQPDLTSMLWK